MNLVELIRSCRNVLGMTLEDLADAASSSKSYVHTLKSGKSYKMDLPLAARFALVLGINVNMMAVASLKSERTAKAQ